MFILTQLMKKITNKYHHHHLTHFVGVGEL